MRNIIELAKQEFYSGLPRNGVFVDLYNGGGFETLDLAKYASEGKVYSFGCGGDIDASCKMYENYELNNIRMINDSASNLEVYVSESIDGAVCRLNGSMHEDEDRLIIGLIKIVERLRSGGRIMFLHQKIGIRAANYLQSLSHLQYACIKLTAVNDALGVSVIIAQRL